MSETRPPVGSSPGAVARSMLPVPAGFLQVRCDSIHARFIGTFMPDPTLRRGDGATVIVTKRSLGLQQSLRADHQLWTCQAALQTLSLGSCCEYPHTTFPTRNGGGRVSRTSASKAMATIAGIGAILRLSSPHAAAVRAAAPQAVQAAASSSSAPAAATVGSGRSRRVATASSVPAPVSPRVRVRPPRVRPPPVQPDPAPRARMRASTTTRRTATSIKKNVAENLRQARSPSTPASPVTEGTAMGKSSWATTSQTCTGATVKNTADKNFEQPGPGPGKVGQRTGRRDRAAAGPPGAASSPPARSSSPRLLVA